MSKTQILLLISLLIVIAMFDRVQCDDLFSQLPLKRVSIIIAAGVFNRVAHIAPEPTRSVMTIVGAVIFDNLRQRQNSGGRGGVEKYLNETLDKLQEHAIQLEAEINDLKASVDEIFKELRFQTLLEYQNDLKAEVDHFQQIVLGYGNDIDKLWTELVRFIDDYKSKNIENKLLNCLNEESITKKSFARSLVEFARKNQDNTRSTVKSSPKKLVHDFYAAIMFKIFESNAFLLNCFTLKNQIKTDDQFENNKRFVQIRNKKAFTKILQSMNSSFALLNNEKDLNAYNTLATPVKVEMKNVLQLFLDVSSDLKPRKSRWFWQYNCKDIDNVHHNSNGCNGVARNCFDTGLRCAENGSSLNIPTAAKTSLYGDSNYKDLQLSNDPDQIYNRKESENSFVFAAKKSCSWLDVVCACICDQTDHLRTERKLYAGVIEAPANVITGVRFSKIYGVIYLQAQIGQLMAGASIDALSVQWMDPPTDIKTNYLTFDYGSRRFLLHDLHFEDAVVTGYQFYYHFNRKVFISMFALKLYGLKLMKPELDELKSGRVFLLSDDVSYVTENNLETRIPGMADYNGNYTISNGNSNIFIKFGASSESIDFGQTFVPFFDGADEIFDVLSPLSGIGFLHYTNDGRYAGYIRPFLKSCDFKDILGYYNRHL